jgi:hypothetical protein
VRTLLVAGANPDLKDDRGVTARDVAVANRYPDIVAVLDAGWRGGSAAVTTKPKAPAEQAPAATASTTLTAEQLELANSIAASLGDGAAAASTVDELKAALLRHLAERGTLMPPLPGWFVAAQEQALDPVPSDGQAHPLRVARTYFLLKGTEQQQVYAFRHEFKCRGTASEDGALQIDC